MQIGDRVHYRDGIQDDDSGLIVAVIGQIETGLTLDILLDSGASIRVVSTAGWSVLCE